MLRGCKSRWKIIMYFLSIYDFLSMRRAKTLPWYLPRLANTVAKEVARQVTFLPRQLPPRFRLAKRPDNP